MSLYFRAVLKDFGQTSKLLSFYRLKATLSTHWVASFEGHLDLKYNRLLKTSGA